MKTNERKKIKVKKKEEEEEERRKKKSISFLVSPGFSHFIFSHAFSIKVVRHSVQK